MGSVLKQAHLGRSAVLHLARQRICKQRAALIEGCEHLVAESAAEAEKLHFGRATALSLSATTLRVQIGLLTERIDAIQAELDEPEVLALAVPVVRQFSLLEQHSAVDETAGLVPA